MGLINESVLRDLIARAASDVVARLEGDLARFGSDRIGYTEAEAAALLGVEKHVLRDARLRGEIKARKVGKRYVYARAELIRYVTG